MTVHCDVCDILSTHNTGKDVVVFETHHWRGVLDYDQRSLGKMFITLREHKSSLGSLSDEQSRDFFEIVKNLEQAIDSAYHPTHVNWQCLMNLAVEAGQQAHVHWHFHPRYDSTRVVQGHEFIDGVKDKTPNPVSRNILEAIREALAGQLPLEYNKR